MAEVYWIRLPEHNDMFTQGYIGITSHTAKVRFKGHLKDSKRKDRKKYPVHNAISKYGDSLVLETLVICSDDYAIDLESKLRPYPKIGWNILAGGNNVKLLRDIKESITHSEESKQKMSKIQKNIWSNNPHKLAKRLEGRSSLPRPVDSQGNPRRFWNEKFNRLKYPPMWSKADEFYEYFNSGIISVPNIVSHFDLKPEDTYWVNKMVRYFLGGWNPSEDDLWISDFKINKESVNGS